mmetsp:Transcript_127506/g.342226  ORF Transcript_127506/g.342226 Transcript_127506/m.342226 type:complete len:235 (+) Transcript_127506:1323-2027(+)
MGEDPVGAGCSRARRLRRPWHRGEDRVRSLLPGSQEALSRHLRRPAERGHRVCAQRARLGGRQLHRVRRGDAAPSGRVPPRGLCHGHGRHDATRLARHNPPRQGLAGVPHLRRQARHLRAPPPPLRGERVLRGGLGGEGHALRGAGRPRPAHGGVRAAGAPLLRGLPVPPRVPEHPRPPGAALPGPRARGRRPPGGAAGVRRRLPVRRQRLQTGAGVSHPRAERQASNGCLLGT